MKLQQKDINNAVREGLKNGFEIVFEYDPYPTYIRVYTERENKKVRIFNANGQILKVIQEMITRYELKMKKEGEVN